VQSLGALEISAERFTFAWLERRHLNHSLAEKIRFSMTCSSRSRASSASSAACHITDHHHPRERECIK
jgi:hypothetical protein